jgi:hypothetical protein
MNSLKQEYKKECAFLEFAINRNYGGTRPTFLLRSILSQRWDCFKMALYNRTLLRWGWHKSDKGDWKRCVYGLVDITKPGDMFRSYEALERK